MELLDKMKAANDSREVEALDNLLNAELERLAGLHPKLSESDPERLQAIAESIANNEIKKQRAAEAMATTINSKDDLRNVLQAEGTYWRAEHTSINENTGTVKTSRMTARDIADILQKHVRFIVIGKNEKELERSQLYFYDIGTGIYSQSQRLIEKMSLLIDNTTRDIVRKDMLKLLRLEAEEKQVTTSYNLVPVNNGIYDKQQKKLLPFNDRYIFVAKIGTNFNPKAKEPTYQGWTVTRWIDEISDGSEEKKRLIWQVIASAINANFIQPYMFFLTDDGQGRTGKSTFEQFLMNLVGSGNYESLKLIEFENDFKVANAIGSALIIGDDNHPGEFNEKSDMLKSMVTGDIVLINPKGIPPYTAQSTALIVQSMNELPKFQDTSGGLARRIKVIKFNHQYADTPAGRLIKDDYIKRPELLEYVLKQALEVDITNLVDTEESKAEVKRIREESNPVAYFVSKYWDDFESERIPTELAFEYFLRVMKKENRPSSMKLPSFSRALQKELPEGWKYKRSIRFKRKQITDHDLKLVYVFDFNYSRTHGGFIRL